MTNFSFLKAKTEYALFAPACMEAERIYVSAPAMCAVGCRKALELAVKWVYAADKSMKMPYKDNLQSLIHEPTFRFAVDSDTWGKMPFIIKLGNLAVHTERSVQPSDALASLRGLFEFVQWIDYCYGADYQERTFDENLVPTGKVAVDTRKIKEQESLLDQKDAEIEALRKQIEQMSTRYTAEKEQHQKERTFQPEDLSEFKTRKIYIDVDLKLMGWKFTGPDADVQEEYRVEDMAGMPGQPGFCDYVLFGKDGLPLAVVEAKRTSKDPNIGRKQAVLYADCLERKFGRRPMMFTTNGFETYFWDDQTAPQRKVSGIFCKDDLQKLMNRRTERMDLMGVSIDDTKSKDGRQLFTPAHFDLIIIDESHRSIFKKYRAIFEYFDAFMVGLTATPKTDVDRNTYDFFEMEHGVPTYAYDYETAVQQDHVLVPYYNYEVKTRFLEEGISYDDLSEEDKERYEDDFIEDGQLPDFIPSAALNKFVFNETTVDIVLQDLMDRGIKVAGGDRLGKTILFAQNKRHAEFILERFNKLYPQYRGSFAQRVICDDAYAQTIIDDFKQPEKEPHIAVSVDMMDTGIDVPECVNLVFFKKVRSKSKFWQMIGRGTRLCKGLACVDQIDGTYTDKRRFLIFDYCGNFEYFRQHKEGYETRETKTLSENIFGKQIKIAMALQENTFAGEDYQAWRKEIVNTCHKQVMALNSDLIAVKLRMQYVEKYKKPEAFVSISEGDKGELLTQIAPLVRSDEADEFAKRFDNFMYGLILAHIEQMPAFQYAKKQLCDTASLLERKASIPQIKAKLPMLQEIHTDAFWDANDILLFEQVRKELRELIRFLDEGGGAQRQIVTKLTDPIIDSQEGVQLEAAYDFEDYRAKVNRYVNEHGNTLAIYKLTHNIPLAMGDYQELERVLTSELGSKEDYAREFGDTPFGLLIRKIAKLDHEAAMQAFSAFINDQSLNQKQIAFVNKIINHIELNGYMENVAELTKPPFDKPISFIKLFDAKTRTALMETINQVRENAVQITAS